MAHLVFLWVRFLYVRGKENVWAWDLPDKPPKEAIDVEYYLELLRRAAETLFCPFDAMPTQVQEFDFKTDIAEMDFSQNLLV